MIRAALSEASTAGRPHEGDLVATNQRLERMTAQQRLAWAMEAYPDTLVVSSSFGAQSAVCLHLAVTLRPDIPIVLVDTGYLFPETYRFVDELTTRLDLNLKVYRAALSPAWQEARYGRLWEQGLEGIERYNRMNKVEPMQRALSELGAEAWVAGLRRTQGASREALRVAGLQGGRLKLHPIIDWTDRDVFEYLSAHDLPYHPLWHKGYVSIGDWHTTRPLHEVESAEETRFFGLKRECGLHEAL
ncbi:phosphoadenylyl-sulfate reductase [Alkalilimnicola sp. S0819]|uniref:phosphoadenylyl-sulfate reductase n=1 Tax=Alkalilimnicola sp. S0819 TaxID=2613922 RepID=UPI0012617BF5|nr:phosphoadenylyl-sulfate reductase [Alkalilimnicola sp. S0819]KAB7622910.1 phosphoadenylyl-sulfate reductase [Alkalilimnicola sp. S0819]MPQ17234.1 phosphoadenylyl-sulfate reductase [Alkalilimnicola sp. S0819]